MSRSFQQQQQWSNRNTNTINNNNGRDRNGSFFRSWKLNNSNNQRAGSRSNSSSINGSSHNRSTNAANMSNNNNNNTNGTVVGTEKMAQLALQTNSTTYNYPKSGFITKIEYSLLYTMMNHPNIYPPSVILSMIEKEDYVQYIYVNKNNNSNDDDNKDSDPSSNTSYAQLSALLALAAEKWPPSTATATASASVTTNSNDTPTIPNPSRRNYDDDEDDDDEYDQSRRRRRQEQQRQSETNSTNSVNIVQVLCQLLIQCIIRHAERYNLDRETEIQELFLPFQKDTMNKTNRNALITILPAYMGLTATILCGGNPIPFYIGYAISINQIAQQEHNLQNYNNIAVTTTRMSNIETTNLLHDTDYNYDYDNNDNDDPK